MPTYTVKWEIDLDAYSYADAARLARQIQQDPASMATVFEVTPFMEHAPVFVIDLEGA